MRKNAGIKSVKEAIQRLIDGEVFYYHGSKIDFVEGRKAAIAMTFGGTPFYENDFCGIHDWEMEVSWEEELPNKPRLCYVSDWEYDQDKRISLIDAYNKGNYITSRGVYWKFAKPLTNDEIRQYIYEDE